MFEPTLIATAIISLIVLIDAVVMVYRSGDNQDKVTFWRYIAIASASTLVPVCFILGAIQ